jgi:hypothetical protein
VQLATKVDTNFGKPVAKIRTKPVTSDLPLFVLGYPSGIPAKYAANGEILSIEKDVFYANLDTFRGNSGSGVYTSDTHELVGILVAGASDFGYDKKRNCYESCKYPAKSTDGEPVRGEKVQAISGQKLLQYLRDLKIVQ